jgi:GMP synthase-like glutamine amidotransferase
MAVTSLRIRVFQHVPFEGIGSMEAWARSRGHSAAFTRFHAGEAPPGPEDYDWLVVMGGPMGVHDEADLPWLKGEKRAVEAALKAKRPVLGICLGAQLMADVLGARVYRNREREIGWFPVDLSAAARGTLLAEAFPARFTPFHWHGDTFEIPSGAVALGSSEACLNQGYVYGENAVALQFHPEVTPASLNALLENCAGDLRPGTYVRSAEDIRAGLAGAPAVNSMMERLCLSLERRCEV